MRKTSIAAFAVLATVALATVASAATISLPPGADGLAAAIAAAGPGGTVLVEPGVHTESGTVTVGVSVAILGAPEAILEVTTSPTITPDGYYILTPALHIMGASDVSVEGLEIRPPAGTIGDTAILVEDAPNARISGNHVVEHQFSILVQHGDRVEITGNVIEASDAWLTGDIPEADGIILINGGFARIEGNTVSNSILGIFGSDVKGRMAENHLTGNYIGIILCNVPPIFLFSGELVGSEVRATGWHVQNNTADGNFDVGYLVIDGAHDNFLANNAAEGNGRVDIDLAGESYRFGFFTPTTYDNHVAVGSDQQLTIQDCAQGSIISGTASIVDNGAEPCF